MAFAGTNVSPYEKMAPQERDKHFVNVIHKGLTVPIETVSKMLGHTNIKTTQTYARITKQKIEKDMADLSFKLNEFQFK